ncbi:MAG: bifunctional metallophosphatase/5'-nucleotidase, partial [candidate division KSB1 bacterium]|nr:bifunctional metallophosphatase/5'-nucleotidase [candidate division KSB1 bacterium]
ATQLSRRVDVIVGGHSHTRITKPHLVNRKLIVQAGTGCRNLGRLDLTVVADTVQSYSGQLIDLWVEGIEKNPSLEKEIERFKKQIDEEYGQVIAYLETDWTRASHQESNIGNFLTDCMREYAGTDFALINSGGIRKDLPAGEIKKMDIKEILPFDNVICTFEVTGAQLMKILQENAQAAVYHNHGVLQVSGLSYRWKKQPDGSIKIVKALINGKPVDSKAIYTGATVDFVLLANAQTYLGFEPEVKKNLMVKFTDVVMEMVTKKGRIHSVVERRMREE